MKEQEYVIEYEVKEKRIKGVVELVFGVFLGLFVSKYIVKFVEFMNLGVDSFPTSSTPFYIVCFAIIGWIICATIPILIIISGVKTLHQIDRLEFRGIKPKEEIYLHATKILSIKERREPKKSNKPFREKVIYKGK